ncbi:MAG: tol-pal system protein YbgF [Hyphomicrobium sp.]|jgi:tol-pal system protein YbgF|nr:tol-pal system protein YbgF [Hyphomicrobium sp.]PPD08654.1 MAG: tol-pal system protein YbgF [Hyphomicrobium sp.]
MTAKRCLGLAVAVVTFAAMAPSAMAQATAPAAAPAAPKAKAAGSGGDGDLRRRVQQLEEQIVDMQVVIGTLESLARSGGAAPAPRVVAPVGGGGADAARIDALDMQVRALTSQIEQLQSGRGGTSAPAYSAPAPAYSAAPAQPAAPSTFGSTTLNAGEGDPIGGLIAQDQPAPAQPSAAPPAVAATDPAATGDPKQAYERAYGFLLQQEYGAAQAGFIEFLKVYPRDSLVPNALYWLGETHYVQRNYADAAEAFDLVTQGYGNSPKAADSMLKRGMALAALGKKQDACGVLGQMPGKYPSAPPHLKSKADSERQRIGCP